MYTAIADIMHAVTGPSDWIADTGATAHIAPLREIFTDYTVLLDNSIVRGVGVTAKVLGKGTIKLSFNFGARKNVIHTLSNVLHIPSAPSCLLSIPKFNETVHGQVIFKENKVILLNNKGAIIGTGHRSKGLYIMQAVSILGPVLVLPAIPTNSASWEIWHRHFGHVGRSSLKFLHDKALAQGFDVWVYLKLHPDKMRSRAWQFVFTGFADKAGAIHYCDTSTRKIKVSRNSYFQCSDPALAEDDDGPMSLPLGGEVSGGSTGADGNGSMGTGMVGKVEDEDGERSECQGHSPLDTSQPIQANCVDHDY